MDNIKLYFRNIFILLVLITSNSYSQNQTLGALFLSSSDYAQLPRPNWDTLSKYANLGAILPQENSGTGGTTVFGTSNNITMLVTPPIGDQGGEGSCVGWAVGYTAMGILSYTHYCSWSNAERSPNYIYNQIKLYNDCGSGSFTPNALNLIQSQGDCSWNNMPYIDGDCSTLPNSTQKNDASMNKAVKWVALNNNDVTSMKRALDLGLPVIIAFIVHQSFYDMWNYGVGVWDVNSGYNTNRGHATCIVGYDDNKQMFKVQNQWGLSGGDVFNSNAGFFWIPYNFIQSGCLKEAYIVYGTITPVPNTIAGSSIICNSESYTIANLPTGSLVTWSVYPSLASIATNGNTANLTTINNGDINLTATVTNLCLTVTPPIVITKPIHLGVPQTLSNPGGMFTSSGPAMSYTTAINGNETWYPCAGYKVYPNIFSDDNTKYNWTVVNRRGPILSTNPPMFYFYSSNQTATIRLTASNECGSIIKEYNFISRNCNNTNNPANPCNHYSLKQSSLQFKKVHVEISNNVTAPCYARMAKDESPLTTETIEAIIIYNKGGEVVKKFGVENLDARMTELDLSDLDEGVYSMEIRGLKEYKELQTFRLTANNEKDIVEDIASGNIVINKADADDRLYVMQQQLFNELLTTKTDLLDNSEILRSFVEKQMGGSFGMAFNISDLLENNEIDKAKDLLSSWIPTNQIDKNYIRYFNYYIRFKNGDDFGDAEIQDMFDLANLCPLNSGEIINAQRTLYYYISKDNTSFDYTCNSPEATCIRTLSNPEICYNASTDPKRINRFKVFQDGDTPTNLDVMVDKTTLDEFAKLNFNTDDLLNEQVQNIRVFDAAGNMAIEKDKIADKQVSIDLSSLAEGNYYIQIDGNKEYKEQQNFKFAVAKSEAQIAEDIACGKTVINTQDADDRKEVMKHQLYKELRGNYDLLNRSSILQDFYVRHKKSDIGMINKINDAFNNYDVTTAQSLIANWQPHNKQGQNCLDYYNHFINYLNGEKPSDEELDNMYKLANSCSQTEGEIVFAARSLYNYITQAGDDFSSACGGTGLRIKNHTTPVTRKTKQSESNTVIYPNPSNGNFSIKFPFGSSGLNTVKVLNEMGKVLFQKTVISGNQNFSINQGLSSGVYMIQITNSITGKTENQKLIVNNQETGVRR